MAKSKNRRKNGTRAKNDNAKRARFLAARDLRDLIICCCIDRVEKDGQDVNVPRTVVYNRKLKRIISITKLQEVALKTERWRWDIHTGILCRKQDGEVYLTREEGVFTETEVLLQEMNDWVADTLCENFQKANTLHGLTMCWIATPYDSGDSLPLEAMLAPVWQYNVLAKLQTKWEIDHPENVILTFKAATLDAFCEWFVDQPRYKQDLKVERQVVVTFCKTSQKMKKGELQALRNLFVLAGFDWFSKVKATVSEFCKVKVDVLLSGEQQANLLGVLNQMPNCLSARVTSDRGIYGGNEYVFNSESH